MPTIPRDYLRGIAAASPFILVIAPFALLFGIVGTEAGLNLLEVLTFSVLVVAGAAQFVALQQLQDHAPVLIILVMSLAVNLRFLMYSAAMSVHLRDASRWQRILAAYTLTDQSFALTMAEAETGPRTTRLIPFYFGSATVMVGLWYVGTVIGALAGSAIPPAFALDFALPITFIAMLAPLLRTLAHVAACFVSIAASLLLAGLPFGTGLLVAALMAMATGAAVETWQSRRGAQA
ncbi:AzlC family ABC transporter permease [Falsirhodobacter algicola]|uniref:Branched-chain amino acid ABC transporter permease n=1 Tax=Falsirhodobacter algicola TaxID=2692330 RepID=A0A8J8MT16_9RHOB|nr:AzlC family ABC transporter permease [Falsirhodobacter algicola]QUS35886.1 branched-chain amino acid ABC transporter permease [Falsirhodobacter algicola]